MTKGGEIKDMSVRITSTPGLTPTFDQPEARPEWIDSSFDQRETTVDGQTFHWTPNLKRSLLDDGVGIAHTSFASTNAAVLDNVFDPNGLS